MRLTTWNCSPGADVDRYLALLSSLDSELVTLQECRKPTSENSSTIWRGTDPTQGIAVISRAPLLRVTPLTIHGLHSTVVPVVVEAPDPFLFVGVWTHPDYNDVAYAAMAACVAAAGGMPVVAAGDFNSSPGVRGQERKSPRFLRQMRDEFGLVSAYHHHVQVAPGEEPCPTYFHRWSEAAPFHIDYVFVPETWTDRITSVEVGTYEGWTSSDHRPLTVTLGT